MDLLSGANNVVLQCQYTTRDLDVFGDHVHFRTTVYHICINREKELTEVTVTLRAKLKLRINIH